MFVALIVKIYRVSNMQLLSLLCLFYSLLFVYRVGVIGSSTMPKIVYNQTIPQNHTLGCTDNETKTLACLNGGSCLIVYIGDRIAQCACYTQYIGNRCEMLDPNITLKEFESTEEKEVVNRHIPGITASVVAVFIVLMAIIFIRRIEKKSSEGNAPETTKMV